jgi:hypothetical protein
MVQLSVVVRLILRLLTMSAEVKFDTEFVPDAVSALVDSAFATIATKFLNNERKHVK